MAYPVPSPGDTVQYTADQLEREATVDAVRPITDEADLLVGGSLVEGVPHESVAEDTPFWSRLDTTAEEAESDAQSEASEETTQDTSEDEADEEAGEEDVTYLCGSTDTVDGDPCENEVDTPGETCHLH